jgi:hypothetical protein
MKQKILFTDAAGCTGLFLSLRLMLNACKLPPRAFGVALAFVVQALVQHAQGVLGVTKGMDPGSSPG